MKKKLIKLRCWLFGHQYKVYRTITPTIEEIYCPRCRKVWGIHHEQKTMHLMDRELKEAHNQLMATMPKNIKSPTK